MGWSAPDLPRDPSRLALGQRQAPIRDEPCATRQEGLRLVQQLPLQRGFSSLGNCGTPQEARHGESWRAHHTDAGRDPEGPAGKALPA